MNEQADNPPCVLCGTTEELPSGDCKWCRAEELLREHWEDMGLNPDEAATLESLSDSEQEAWLRSAE